MYIVFVLTVSIHPKKERTLNVVRAVNLPATAASSAREGLGLSPVCLFRCGQEVGHCESLNYLPKNLYIFVKQVIFINTNILQDFILVSLTGS